MRRQCAALAEAILARLAPPGRPWSQGFVKKFSRSADCSSSAHSHHRSESLAIIGMRSEALWPSPDARRASRPSQPWRQNPKSFPFPSPWSCRATRQPAGRWKATTISRPMARTWGAWRRRCGRATGTPLRPNRSRRATEFPCCCAHSDRSLTRVVSPQVMLVVNVVLDAINSQGLTPSPAAIFAASVASLNSDDVKSSPEVRFIATTGELARDGCRRSAVATRACRLHSGIRGVHGTIWQRCGRCL